MLSEMVLVHLQLRCTVCSPGRRIEYECDNALIDGPAVCAAAVSSGRSTTSPCWPTSPLLVSVRA